MSGDGNCNNDSSIQELLSTDDFEASNKVKFLSYQKKYTSKMNAIRVLSQKNVSMSLHVLGNKEKKLLIPPAESVSMFEFKSVPKDNRVLADDDNQDDGDNNLLVPIFVRAPDDSPVIDQIGTKKYPIIRVQNDKNNAVSFMDDKLASDYNSRMDITSKPSRRFCTMDTKLLVEEIGRQINDIRENYGLCRNVDDPEDLKRRDSRAIEFAKRFSRNFLYQISRLTDDIKISKLVEMSPKIIAVFELISKALDTYSKNLTVFVSINLIPPKLERLLFYILDVFQICRSNNVFNENSLPISILNKITEKINHFLMILESNKRNLKYLENEIIPSKVRNPLTAKANNLNKLAMYATASTQKTSLKLNSKLMAMPQGVTQARLCLAKPTNSQTLIETSGSSTEIIPKSDAAKKDSSPSTLGKRHVRTAERLMRLRRSLDTMSTFVEGIHSETESVEDMNIENIFEHKHQLTLVDDLVTKLNDFQKHIKNKILSNLEANRGLATNLLDVLCKTEYNFTLNENSQKVNTNTNANNNNDNNNIIDKTNHDINNNNADNDDKSNINNNVDRKTANTCNSNSVTSFIKTDKCINKFTIINATDDEDDDDDTDNDVDDVVSNVDADDDDDYNMNDMENREEIVVGSYNNNEDDNDENENRVPVQFTIHNFEDSSASSSVTSMSATEDECESEMLNVPNPTPAENCDEDNEDEEDENLISPEEHQKTLEEYRKRIGKDSDDDYKDSSCDADSLKTNRSEESAKMPNNPNEKSVKLPKNRKKKPVKMPKNPSKESVQKLKNRGAEKDPPKELDAEVLRVLSSITQRLIGDSDYNAIDQDLDNMINKFFQDILKCEMHIRK